MKLEIVLIFLIECISAFPGPSSYNTFYDPSHDLEESKFVKILKYRLNRTSPILLLFKVIKSHSAQNFESARNFIKTYNGEENLRSKRFLSFRQYHRFDRLLSFEVSTWVEFRKIKIKMFNKIGVKRKRFTLLVNLN